MLFIILKIRSWTFIINRMQTYRNQTSFPVLVLLLALFLANNNALAENINLPDIGSTAEAVLSVEDEKRLGKAFLRSVRHYYRLVDDALVNDYIQGLGNRLTSHIDGVRFDYNFFVVDEPTINAFAGPGGHIGINTGTILATESESELASVLAHEIAHVTQRHLQRSFEKANDMSLPTAAALIAAVLLGSKNIEVGEALLAASVAGSTQTQINFTRTHEHEADRVGMQLLAGAGFDPRAMPVFFERLQKSTLGANVFPEFLSTHPITISRISDTRNRAEQYPRPNKNSKAASNNFYIIQSRLKFAAQKNTRNLAKQHENNLNTGHYVNSYAQRYSHTLALMSEDKLDAARSSISKLIKDDQERIPYLLTQAQIEIQDGSMQKAISLLSQSLKLYPSSTPLIILYTKILIDDGQIKQSKQLLKQQIRHDPENPYLYKLLAHAEKKDGFNSAAYQALAEHDYLNGRTRLAINHLQMALRQSGTQKYARSRIEARLEEFKKEVLLEQEIEKTE